VRASYRFATWQIGRVINSVLLLHDPFVFGDRVVRQGSSPNLAIVPIVLSFPPFIARWMPRRQRQNAEASLIARWPVVLRQGE
jgi:hypothetical protein